MTWLSGPCVNPGEQPTEAVRAIHEAPLEQPDGEPGPGAARWPGHEIEDDEVETLRRLRDGIAEL